jgi:hypothetical protein
MNFFTKLEKSLGTIIETALFARPGGKIQPIEIARALWTEITANQRTGMKETYIPNFFIISLTPDDYCFLEPVRESVESEILRHIESESRKRDFRTLGHTLIQWKEDENLKDGEFLVKSVFAKEDELPNGITGKTKQSASVAPAGIAWSVPAEPGESKTQPEVVKKKNIFEDTLVKGKPVEIVSAPSAIPVLRAKLEVTEGFDRGKSFVVDKFPATIGRSAVNDISIGDPQVSGKHAVLIEENGKPVIEDTKSRAGLFVNDKKVERWVLQDGDELFMGITKIKVYFNR